MIGDKRRRGASNAIRSGRGRMDCDRPDAVVYGEKSGSNTESRVHVDAYDEGNTEENGKHDNRAPDETYQVGRRDGALVVVVLDELVDDLVDEHGIHCDDDKYHHVQCHRFRANAERRYALNVDVAILGATHATHAVLRGEDETTLTLDVNARPACTRVDQEWIVVTPNVVADETNVLVLVL